MTRPDPARYRAIFFDAGFTLIYADPSVPVRCAQVAVEHGFAVTPEQVAAVMPRAEIRFHHILRDEPDTWASDDALVVFWRGFYGAIFDALDLPPGPVFDHCCDTLYHIYNEPGAWALYPDALPAVQALHAAGYTLGIISDWGTRLAHRILLPLGLGRYFDFMVVSASVRWAKPGLPLYTEALRRAGVAPHQALHIGDNYVLDVLGARAAGITPVLLDRADHARSVDCLRLTTLAALPPLLAELEGRAAAGDQRPEIRDQGSGGQAPVATEVGAESPSPPRSGERGQG
jgi:HAD superfamily hydrolase (TIGR01549 family)